MASAQLQTTLVGRFLFTIQCKTLLMMDIHTLVPVAQFCSVKRLFMAEEFIYASYLKKFFSEI